MPAARKISPGQTFPLRVLNLTLENRQNYGGPDDDLLHRTSSRVEAEWAENSGAYMHRMVAIPAW